MENYLEISCANGVIVDTSLHSTEENYNMLFHTQGE
jgi:hypothetical protein